MARGARIDYEEIKLYIENNSDSELLTTKEDYIGNKMIAKSKLQIKCSCGDVIFERSFKDVKKTGCICINCIKKNKVKKTKLCVVCGKKLDTLCCYSEKYNGFLCLRHYQQVIKWGEVRKSKGDKNEIILFNEHAEIVLYDKELNEKARALIDLEDVERVKTYKWVVRNDGYCSAKINGKGIKLHRFIMNVQNKEDYIDHINRIKLDCRKSNLRIVDISVNNLNKSIRKDNKTGVSGVYKHRDSNKWIAEIKMNYENISLGSYEDFDNAVKARLEAELKYYGEYAPQKHLFKEYGIK